VDSNPPPPAHALGHGLGLLDDHSHPSAANRFTPTSPGVHTDDSLMGNYWMRDPVTGKPIPKPGTEVKPRHWQQIQDDIDKARGGGAATHGGHGAPAPAPPLSKQQVAAMSDQEVLEQIEARIPNPAQRARLTEEIPHAKTLLKYLGRGSTPEEIEAGLAKVSASGIPQGLTEEEFAEFSADLRAELGRFGGDIRVQGSRAAGVAQEGGDIDIAIRVPQERFDQIVDDVFSQAKEGSSLWRTMEHARATGKIQRRWLGLSNFAKQMQAKYGFADSDISVVLIGGATDNKPWVPVR
jgi:hypothetical protein